MKKIFILFIILFNFQLYLFGKAYLLSDKSKCCKSFILGLKHEKIKFTKKINEANVIIICGQISEIPKTNRKIPIISTLVDFCCNNKDVKIVLKKFPSIRNQIKIINKITQKLNKFGIILNDKEKIKCLENCKIKNLKIYKIKKSYEIPLKVDNAVKENDIILLYPDRYLKNPLALEFVIKKIILSGKSYVAYDKKFLNLGARIVFYEDFFTEGKNFASIINNLPKSKRILEPKFYSVLTEK